MRKTHVLPTVIKFQVQVVCLFFFRSSGYTFDLKESSRHLRNIFYLVFKMMNILQRCVVNLDLFDHLSLGLIFSPLKIKTGTGV